MLRLPAVLATVLFVSGCASKGALLGQIEADLAAFEPTPLCADTVLVVFHDLRTDVTERPLRLPFMSLPGQHDDVSPPLADTLKAVVRAEINRLVMPGAERFGVEVRVLEGRQSFDATWRAEQETARWAIEIALLGQSAEAVGGAEVSYTAQSMDASSGFSERLFRLTLRQATVRAFSEAVRALPVTCRQATLPDERDEPLSTLRRRSAFTE